MFYFNKERREGGRESSPAARLRLQRACLPAAARTPSSIGAGKGGGSEGGALTQHLLTQLDKEHKPKTAPILVLALRRPFKDGDGETDQLGLVYSPALLSSSSERGGASFPERNALSPPPRAQSQMSELRERGRDALIFRVLVNSPCQPSPSFSASSLLRRRSGSCLSVGKRRKNTAAAAVTACLR